VILGCRVSDIPPALFRQNLGRGITGVDRFAADPHPFVAISEKECSDAIVVL
jgi:hypothetical protein